MISSKCFLLKNYIGVKFSSLRGRFYSSLLRLMARNDDFNF